MSLLKSIGGALVVLALSASPALAQISVGFSAPVVRLRMAPPAPLVETIPMAPSPRHIWTAGHWQWNAMQGRHVWVAGYYQLGQPGQLWVQARWVNRGGEFIFEPGHWAMAGAVPVYNQPQPVYQPPPQPVYQPPPQPVYQPPPQPVYQPPVQEVYQPPVQDVYAPPQPIQVAVEMAPPPPQVEVIPVAPSPNHFWIAGYWGWRNGAHFWYPGRYELRRPGYSWQAPVWTRGDRGGWTHTPGYWRR